MVENVGADMDEFETMDDCATILPVNSPYVVMVDPSNVENEPDVTEKDETTSVELTVNVFTVIFALEMVDVVIVDPCNELK
jgi:hypothetical protein